MRKPFSLYVFFARVNERAARPGRSPPRGRSILDLAAKRSQPVLSMQIPCDWELSQIAHRRLSVSNSLTGKAHPGVGLASTRTTEERFTWETTG
jgi:hypothetical protein